MKFTQAILIPLALSFAASCGGGGASVMDEMNDAQAALVTTLKGIDSPESAKAAEPKLKEFGERMESLQAKMKSLSGEEVAKMAERMLNTDMVKRAESLQAELVRLMSSPEIASELGPILEKLGKK